MRKPLPIIFLGTLLALCILSAMTARGAQNYYFSRITSDNGLSHNNVKCITQDSYGFIWFGTRNGLNRYDGHTIRIIDCDDHVSGHANHNISALYEDDQGQMWVGTDKGVFVYDPVSELFRNFTETSAGGIAITNWISEINADSAGNIWIVSPYEGVFRWDGERLFHYWLTPEDNYNAQHPESMCIRRNGQVWIGTTGAGLFRYYPNGDRFEQIVTDPYGGSLEGEYIFSICDYGNSLAIAVHEGELKKYDPQSGRISVIDVPQVHRTILRDVAWFGGSELWVATHEGIFIVDEEKGTATHLREDPLGPYGISDKACSVIYQDREKGVWVGTMLGGVNYCANNSLDFDKYLPYDRREGVIGKKIRGLAEGPDGRIWIGTEDEGICVLDPETGETRTVDYSRAKRERLTNTLEVNIDGDELWYGIFKEGLGVVDLRSGRLNHIENPTLGIGEASIYAICRDSRGSVWLSTESNVYVRRGGSDEFAVVEGLRGAWVFDIAEDSRGNVWFSCMGMGLGRYNPADESIVNYTNSPGDTTSLSSNSVSSVFEDSRGRIWISTDRGGLCRYNHETDDFRNYSIREGLPDDMVYKVLEDSAGRLWFGTNRGLVEFNPENAGVTVYTREDGLPGNQFNYNAAMKDRSGRLWFGGVDGIVSFVPERNKTSDFIPQLFFTRLAVNNVEQIPGAEGSLLDKNILFADKVTLPHDRSNIGVEFAAVHFSNNGAVDYLYRMEGIEDRWIEAGDSHGVYFSQLAPGNYVLHVKAVNRAQGWERAETSLAFTVCPPWWWTILAKVIYIALSLGVLIAVVYVFLRHRRRKMLEQQRLFEVEKEKELYRTKVDFFNEIAHEVRTPLTLINGPLEDVIEMNADRKLDKNLNTISKNTRRLLDLIHELLDFKNVDTNKFRMNYVWVDIPALVAEVAERFEPSIDKRGMALLVDLGEDDFSAAIDREAVTKILSNLLSNAMKYAASLIRVSIIKNGGWFSVRVISDGKKIPVHLAEKIFEPFYRMDSASSEHGTGIGLSLSRSLAQLQKGNLFLDVNSPGEDNRFVLMLPLVPEEEAMPLEQAKSSDHLLPDPETVTVSTPEGEHKVLLVENNHSMLDYLAGRLRESCTVLTATNGVEALDVLRTQNVDLVVTDLMMPDMDGMELCRRLKNEDGLQYTPVVFLTARNDLQAKIDGLEAGAEAFVEKPFSFAYLKALIFSIMENRKKERESFAKLPFVPVSNIKMNAADQQFIDKVIDTIHTNIVDENLNVEYLADKMCMNRSSLLRKIKSISGMSAVDFIKVVRLKRAATMLSEGHYLISEVCYAVGISSPSYFSKLFQHQFGMLPKEFERQNHHKTSI